MLFIILFFFAPQKLAEFANAVLPNALSAAATGAAPAAGAVARRLDLKQPPLREVLQV